MLPLTVVIITRNEASNITACIESARQITNDIVVVDSGSTDGTIELVNHEKLTLIHIQWKGFGTSRNIGARAARYNWIFSLDADERISRELADKLHTIDFTDEKLIYRLRRKNYLAGKQLRFGTAGFDWPERIYNRNHASWDLSPVHEELQHKGQKPVKIHGGHIVHYSMKSLEHYKQKLTHYASLCALKYQQKNKQATYGKRFIAPLFNSCKSYIFQLGFLDGRKGFQVARLILFYTYLKYKFLYQMRKEQGRKIDLSMPYKASA